MDWAVGSRRFPPTATEPLLRLNDWQLGARTQSVVCITQGWDEYESVGRVDMIYAGTLLAVQRGREKLGVKHGAQARYLFWAWL